MNVIRIRPARSGHTARRWSMVLLLAPALASALAACGRAGQGPATASAAPPPMSVGPENIAVVDSATVVSGPVISGALTPQQAATIRAEVAGPVVQTYVEKGQPVHDGQVIARIDATALQASVLSARSAVASAQEAATNAQRNLERQQALEQAGAVATNAVEQAQAANTAAQAQLANARAALAAQEQQLSRTTVRAPFAGIVSARPVNAGDVVQPGTAIATVVNPASMQLVGAVPAEAIRLLRVGQAVQFTVNGYPGRQFVGRIDRINPVADSATRQVSVYVTLPNAGGSLVGGLFAQGRVAAEHERGLVVPVGAVDQTGVAPTVIRLAHGKTERVPVQLGARDEQSNTVQITSGVSRGDTLLVGAAAQSVTPGTPVQVTRFADSAATAAR